MSSAPVVSSGTDHCARCGSATGLPLRLAVGVVLAVAALARWNLADLADWGIDESANLWMGTLLLDGRGWGLGLISSRGVPNPAGAPLLAAPLSLLPDLLAVSRALSLLHLLALALLGFVLARRTALLPIAIAVLALHPAALLASLSLWNQYLSLPVLAGALALLLVVAEEAAAPRARAVALAGFAGLLLLGAAVHLAGFVDLAVLGAVCFAALAARPRPIDGIAVAAGAAAVALGGGVLFAPWLAVAARFTPARTILVCAGCAVACAACAHLIAAAPRSPFRGLLERLAASRRLAWSVPAVLAGCAWLAAVAVFRGAQPARRLIEAGDPWGFALLAAQGALVGVAAPAWLGTLAACRARAPLGELLRTCCSGREHAAAVLLAAAPLLVAARWLIEPRLLDASGRPDLLLPLFPALAAPLVLFAVCAQRTRITAVSCVAAGIVVLAFSIAGPTARFWSRHRLLLPPSEMREAVDWIAARHRAAGGGSTIDVGYDLLEGREWVLGARGPFTTWYTVSRPFDWLFLRRHGLAALREGTYSRVEGGDYTLSFRQPARSPVGGAATLSLPHLDVRDVRGRSAIPAIGREPRQ